MSTSKIITSVSLAVPHEREAELVAGYRELISGSVKVPPLCEGLLEVRYEIEL